MVSAFKIGLCCHIVRQGGVIAYPTETVMGLGCDPYNNEAVRHLLALKHRPEEKGLIIIGANINQLTSFIGKLSIQQQQLLSQPIAHPTTWLAPKSATAPSWITGKHDTIAIRITTHSIANKLCQHLGHALVSTSANITGQAVVKTSHELIQSFGQAIHMITNDSQPSLGTPSEIRNILTGEIVRASTK